MISAKFAPQSKVVFYPNLAMACIGALVASISQDSGGVKIVLCDTVGECEKLYPKVAAFLKLENCADDLRVLPKILPKEDPDFFESYCERVGTLNAMSSGANLTILTTPEALIQETPVQAEHLELKVGGKFDIQTLKQKLVDFGYYNEVLCEGPGQFALRGGIIDIYPIAARSPYRIDFFGDEIDSIKPYDPDTQLTQSEKLDKLQIDSFLSTQNNLPSYEFLAKQPATWIFIEPQRLSLEYPELFSVFENSKDSRKNLQIVFDTRKSDTFIGLSSLAESGELFKEAKPELLNTEDLSQYRPLPMSEGVGVERFESEHQLRLNFIKKISEWAKSDYKIYMEAEGEGERERIAEMFAECKLKTPKFEFIEPFFGEGFLVSFEAGQSPFKWRGMDEKAKGLVCVGQLEIFGRRIKSNIAPRRKMLTRRAEVDSLLDFSELSEGDYVVHITHGICRYQGITTLDSSGTKQEVLKLEFEDKAILYLPLHKSHLISRYIGLDKRVPKLSKLDSRAWIKVRTAAETAALDYASELLDLQSKREIAEGYAFAPDTNWQTAFEDSFPYVETPDQLRAINEVKTDMQKPVPMDRLICADVGFGKTEIALRAAFKAAMSGKQVAVLCPTTILCQQHFKTFRERMAPYPIVVEMMSRFRKSRELAKIKGELSIGKIDIVIGTHALLANDVKFKDLGLLVIDEEHRFGVKHKEKIKHIKEGVDVLTMSATPIPRTLYFAMMGAKTISVIETPPKNRFPVETIVKEYSDETVREAMRREVERGGQVFYLHNRVKTIEETAKHLEAMFPNLRIGVGHGQMDERELEKLMGDFMDGKYDILVCTTIIESGLDIPNCNTIIIEGADKFGLAQLYQLRGRVGRFTRKAYAYLLLHRHAQIVASAHKRLSAIRQYNKPGAGFRIATRDLQLRGCGNLLGAKQSGHIASVGFDMYCSLLKQSIARLKGEKSASWIRSTVSLDFISLGEGGKREESLSNANNMFEELKVLQIKEAGGKMLSAYIPESYIPQTQLRIDLYRRLELSASIEEIDKIESQTKDRFGKIPDCVKYLFELAKIRVYAELNSILKVETEGAVLKLRKANPAEIEFVKINGHFPKLAKKDSKSRLLEIKRFLRDVLPSITKKA